MLVDTSHLGDKMKTTKELAADIWREVQDKLLKDWSEWVGRRVEGTYPSWDVWSGQIVVFEDGTFSAQYGMEEHRDVYIGFIQDATQLSVDDLVSADIITPEQGAILIRARKEKRAAREEAREKATLARLMAKYQGGV